MKPKRRLGIFNGLFGGKSSNGTPLSGDVTDHGDRTTGAGSNALEKTNVTVVTSNGGLKVFVRDVEYNLRSMKPAHGVGVSELKRSLERNREMIGQSFQKMMDIRRHFKTSTDPLVIETEGAYRTATKNALVARANIDVLIPLINIRGGDAEYEGAGEGLPIELHVEQLRRRAEMLVDLDLGEMDNGEFNEGVELQSVFIAGVIVVLMVMLLWVFL